MEWIFAQNLAEALSSATPDSRYVGGGLSLTLLAERGVERADRLIDLSALPLRKIEGRQGELRKHASQKQQHHETPRPPPSRPRIVRHARKCEDTENGRKRNA